MTIKVILFKNRNTFLIFIISKGRTTCLTTLVSHLERCGDAKNTQPLKLYAKFTSNSSTPVTPVYKEKMKKAQAKFIAGTRSSFLMAENKHLLDMVQLGIEIGCKFGNVNVNSVASGRQGVKGQICATVSEHQAKLQKSIQESLAYSLTSDIWSDSVNHCSYLDITIFFVKNDSYKIEHQILAFR